MSGRLAFPSSLAEQTCASANQSTDGAGAARIGPSYYRREVGNFELRPRERLHPVKANPMSNCKLRRRGRNQRIKDTSKGLPWRSFPGATSRQPGLFL